MSDTTTNLSQQIQTDYLAYSMAVIIGRAIPSLHDGLKPAQRRVLTAMKHLGLKPDGRFMKSARVDGETTGKYHPHGGAYGVMVTMAAPWNNNLPFIDGQGNWGSSVDGAAAARYTECKTSAFTWECLLSDSDTWQLTENYDGSLKEPVELNVKVPSVLLNGQDGIGVGFSTKIPPHSLRDVCDAVCKGTVLTPSFPTGCDIVKDEGLSTYQETGIGTLRLRAKNTTSSTGTGKRAKPVATFTNLPFGTNPEKIGQQIKDGLDKGHIKGVTGINDQSDLSGDCLEVTFKAGTDLKLALRELYHYTDLDFKYSARLLVVDGTKPVELSPGQLISRWKEWRLDRLGAIFAHELTAKETRLDIVIGLIKAISKIDTVIKLIRASDSKKDALIALVGHKTLRFNKAQASAILEMRLHQLTNLDSTELESEKDSLESRITELQALIKDKKARTAYMTKEVRSLGTRHGEKRRSDIIDVPEGLVVTKTSTRATATVSKPRYLKIDMKRGIIEQAKGPRGATLLEKNEKLITLTEDGTLRKLPSNYKGPLGQEYTPVILAKKESFVKDRAFLLVFTLGDQLKAMTVSGEDLTKTTSKGKQALPEGATLVYFGEDTYQVPWSSSRKKKVKLSTKDTKAGKPGGKGIKVANLSDLSL